MSRKSWFDPQRERPLIEEQLFQLDTYMQALADGIIDADELEAQKRNVIEVMKDVEPRLDDELHERVTKLLMELTAYNVMRLLHQLRRQRLAADQQEP